MSASQKEIKGNRHLDSSGIFNVSFLILTRAAWSGIFFKDKTKLFCNIGVHPVSLVVQPLQKVADAASGTCGQSLLTTPSTTTTADSVYRRSLIAAGHCHCCWGLLWLVAGRQSVLTTSPPTPATATAVAACGSSPLTAATASPLCPLASRGTWHSCFRM